MLRLITLLVASTIMVTGIARAETIYDCKVEELKDAKYFKKDLDAKKNNKVVIEKNFKDGIKVSIGKKVYSEALDDAFDTSVNAIDDVLWDIDPAKNDDKIRVIIQGVARDRGRVMVTKVTKKGTEDLYVADLICE